MVVNVLEEFEGVMGDPGMLDVLFFRMGEARHFGKMTSGKWSRGLSTQNLAAASPDRAAGALP